MVRLGWKLRSALCDLNSFSTGRCTSIIELVAQLREPPVQTGRCGFESRPETSKSPLARPSVAQLSTGRRIGLSLITTWSPVRVRPPETNAGVAQR